VMVSSGSDILIELSGVTKTYGRGAASVVALDELDLNVRTGEFVAITGPSGSGKSTLLNLLAGIDQPSSGSLSISGKDLTVLPRRKLSQWRSGNVGFVYQAYNLVSVLTVRENTELRALLNLTRQLKEANARCAPFAW